MNAPRDTKSLEATAAQSPVAEETRTYWTIETVDKDYRTILVAMCDTEADALTTYRAVCQARSLASLYCVKGSSRFKLRSTETMEDA